MPEHPAAHAAVTSRLLAGRVGGRARPVPRRLLNARSRGAWWFVPVPRLWWELRFEPRDAWIGVYWTRPHVAWRHAIDIYVCALPCLPLKLALRWEGRLRPLDDWQDACDP